jgi:hypothetical protein
MSSVSFNNDVVNNLSNAVLRKPCPIAPHLLIEAPGLHAVECGQVGIKQDLLRAQHDDVMCDRLQR